MTRLSQQLVLTTCPDPATATALAEALVTERLAACVNILPGVRSVYTWKGQTESATEQLLIIKSRTDRYSAIQERILALHPYELPEVIAVPIADGLPAYLAWISNPEDTE